MTIKARRAIGISTYVCIYFIQENQPTFSLQDKISFTELNPYIQDEGHPKYLSHRRLSHSYLICSTLDTENEALANIVITFNAETLAQSFIMDFPTNETALSIGIDAVSEVIVLYNMY
jgi:hypothetical protein